MAGSSGRGIGAVSAFSWWPFITWAWLIAFLIRSGRFVWGLTNNHRLARAGRGKTNPYWQHRLEQLAALLGISGRVKLLESPAINVPAIIGVLKPVILIPLGVFASMPADQLEAVLLHELAHIRRKDFYNSDTLSYFTFICQDLHDLINMFVAQLFTIKRIYNLMHSPQHFSTTLNRLPAIQFPTILN